MTIKFDSYNYIYIYMYYTWKFIFKYYFIRNIITNEKLIEEVKKRDININF